jgi:hypothetical protein
VSVDRAHLGLRYGPYRFEVGRESVLDFVAATSGLVPGRVFHAAPPAAELPPGLPGDDAPGPLVAPPSYAAVFAIQPFASACADPRLALHVLRLIHGEQEFEFHEPVRAGDVLVTTGQITRLQERANLDFLEVTTETVNQHGRLVVRGIWTAIVRN